MSPLLIRLDSESPFALSTPVGQPLGELVALTRTTVHRPLADGNGVTGIWECAPGRFRRQIEQAECSYIVSGEGRFTPDEGRAVEFRAGDAFYLAAATQDTWDIRQTVRKTYLIFD